MDRLDVVIFGATGFTGKHAVIELVRLLPEYKDLTWGIAGRSKDKLTSIIKKVESATGVNLSDIPLIIADIKNEQSLLSMAKKAKVILNCCGPFRFLGEPVVKACIQTKTHQVTIAGESQFIQKMVLKYNQTAEDAGVYIVSACGCGCIPSDLGVVFLESQFDGTVNSIESHMNIDLPVQETPSLFHYSAFESVVYMLSNYTELRKLNKGLFAEKLPTLKPTLWPRFLHKYEEDDKWYVPFFGSDSLVIEHTQRHFLETKKKRPIQAQIYIGFPLIVTIFLMFYGFFFVIAVQFKWARNIILQHPNIFTFGTMTHEGPTDSTSENSKFSVYIHGRGWDKTVTDFNRVPPNRAITVKVSGANPGYGATCIGLVLSGLTILKEQHKIPGKGGVLSPGAAFAETDLIQNLNKHNFKFEVVRPYSRI